MARKNNIHFLIKIIILSPFYYCDAKYKNRKNGDECGDLALQVGGVSDETVK
jgi:hypothetical protein